MNKSLKNLKYKDSFQIFGIRKKTVWKLPKKTVWKSLDTR